MIAVNPTSKQEALQRAQGAARRMERRVAVLTVILPLVATFVAMALLFRAELVPPIDLVLCFSFCFLTMLGVTAGFHRLFTHRSFETGKPVQYALGILGSMSAQGPLLFWVAAHRRHHQHSDSVNDPHSPHLHGSGTMALLRGLFHAHLGWMFSHEPESWFKYAPDVVKSPVAFRISVHYPTWVLSGLLLPGLLQGLWSWSFSGVAMGILWGGLVRMFLAHHLTWSINSLCHVSGKRPFETGDQSTNHWLFGTLALGEGWHNNHHAFPWSARHGLRWWQLDISYLFIRCLELLGVAWNVKIPSASLLEQKRRGSGPDPQPATQGPLIESPTGSIDHGDKRA